MFKNPLLVIQLVKAIENSVKSQGAMPVSSAFAEGVVSANSAGETAGSIFGD